MFISVITSIAFSIIFSVAINVETSGLDLCVFIGEKNIYEAPPELFVTLFVSFYASPNP
jgi:hypothetical protein